MPKHFQFLVWEHLDFAARDFEDRRLISWESDEDREKQNVNQGQNAGTELPLSDPVGRSPDQGMRDRISTFLDSVERATGVKITKRDIWHDCIAHKKATDFERVQQGTGTRAAKVKIEEVLSIPPRSSLRGF